MNLSVKKIEKTVSLIILDFINISFLLLATLLLIDWFVYKHTPYYIDPFVTFFVFFITSTTLRIWIKRDRIMGRDILFTILITVIVLFILLLFTCTWTIPDEDYVTLYFSAPKWLGGEGHSIDNLEELEGKGMLGLLLHILYATCIFDWHGCALFFILMILLRFSPEIIRHIQWPSSETEKKP